MREYDAYSRLNNSFKFYDKLYVLSYVLPINNKLEREIQVVVYV